MKLGLPGLPYSQPFAALSGCSSNYCSHAFGFLPLSSERRDKIHEHFNMWIIRRQSSANLTVSILRPPAPKIQPSRSMIPWKSSSILGMAYSMIFHDSILVNQHLSDFTSITCGVHQPSGDILRQSSRPPRRKL